MSFSVKDLRFTVRRDRDGEQILHPRLFHDRSVLPKVAIAIEHFELMVGRERRELDAEVFVHFFGDHKLARCMLAALARSYRYRPRRLPELVGRVSARRLDKAGIKLPRQLRLALYDHLNTTADGFATAATLPARYSELAAGIGIRADELERCLYLDAEEHAVLIRVGQRPDPADVVAHFNFRTLEALLRQAATVELPVTAWTPDMEAVASAIAGANGVEITLDRAAGVLRLPGRQDALGAWSRHGRRLARTLVELLERGRAAFGDGGAASIALPTRTPSLRLGGEALAILGAPNTAAGWADDLATRRALLAGVITAARAARAGWTVRRLPDPQAWSSGVLLPDLLLRSADAGLLVCAVRTPAQAARLAVVAARPLCGDPLLFVGAGEALAPLRAIGAATLSPEEVTAAALRALLPAAQPLAAARPAKKTA